MPSFNFGVGLKTTLEVSNKEQLSNCPICGEKPCIHGYYPKIIAFGIMNGNTVEFELNHCRFQCKHCAS